MRLTSKLHVILLFASATAAAPLLRAQQDSTLSPGSRVRVRVSNQPDLLVGTYTRRTDRALIVEKDSGQVAVAITDITELWVSRGRHAHGALGFAIGAVVGLGAGAAIAAATTSTSRSSGFGGPDISPAAGGAIGGFVLGGLLGVAIGGNIRGERWMRERASTSTPLVRSSALLRGR